MSYNTGMHTINITCLKEVDEKLDTGLRDTLIL